MEQLRFDWKRTRTLVVVALAEAADAVPDAAVAVGRRRGGGLPDRS
jgi:hypothetical protein